MKVYSIDIFSDSTNKIRASAELNKSSKSIWPILLTFVGEDSNGYTDGKVTLYLHDEDFIQIKNEILQLDRKRELQRKENENAEISEGLTNGT